MHSTTLLISALHALATRLGWPGYADVCEATGLAGFNRRNRSWARNAQGTAVVVLDTPSPAAPLTATERVGLTFRLAPSAHPTHHPPGRSARRLHVKCPVCGQWLTVHPQRVRAHADMHTRRDVAPAPKGPTHADMVAAAEKVLGKGATFAEVSQLTGLTSGEILAVVFERPTRRAG